LTAERCEAAANVSESATEKLEKATENLIAVFVSFGLTKSETRTLDSEETEDNTVFGEKFESEESEFTRALEKPLLHSPERQVALFNEVREDYLGFGRKHWIWRNIRIRGK
jgi:hypothetical protein